MIKDKTTTELLKIANNLSEEHDKLKTEILIIADEFDEIQNNLNDKIELLKKIESEYILVIEEMNIRNAI